MSCIRIRSVTSFLNKESQANHLLTKKSLLHVIKSDRSYCRGKIHSKDEHLEFESVLKEEIMATKHPIHFTDSKIKKKSDPGTTEGWVRIQWEMSFQ